MRELPMLLNGDGVRATLAGMKTQTRRPMRPQPLARVTSAEPWIDGLWRIEHVPVKNPSGPGKCVGLRARNPLGIPGDLLYVRETWRCEGHGDHGQFVIRYRADNATNGVVSNYGYQHEGKWRPSIHMPKWAARTWARNTGVRAERIQDIPEDDVIAEGVRRIEEIADDLLDYKVYFESDAGRSTCPFEAYAMLWDSIYAKKGLGWDANPWVFVTSYEVIER